MEKRKPIEYEDHRRWESIIILNPEVPPGKPCAICGIEPDNHGSALELVLRDDLRDGRVVVCEQCGWKHADFLMEALNHGEKVRYAQDIEHLTGVVYEVMRVRAEMENSLEESG